MRATAAAAPSVAARVAIAGSATAAVDGAAVPRLPGRDRAGLTVTALGAAPAATVGDGDGAGRARWRVRRAERQQRQRRERAGRRRRGGATASGALAGERARADAGLGEDEPDVARAVHVAGDRRHDRADLLVAGP